MADEAATTAADGAAAQTKETTAAAGDASEGQTQATADATTTTAVAEEAKGYWADDWRDRLVSTLPQKDRDAALKRLNRFQSPEGIFTSYRALEQRMSSGDLRSALKEGATDAEVAQWRKDNGIPGTPEEYLAKLPDGLVIGDDDKPAVSAFTERMHGRNAPPELVHEAIAWWNDQKEAAAAAMAEKDAEMHTAAEDALRSEWGGEFRGNLNALKNYWAGQPALADGTSMLDVINGARLPDGRKLGNIPEVAKWLVGVVREINPAATVMPGADVGQQASAITDELASIRATMGDPSSPYNRDGGKTQKRYLELLTAQEKLASRAA